LVFKIIFLYIISNKIIFIFFNINKEKKKFRPLGIDMNIIKYFLFFKNLNISTKIINFNNYLIKCLKKNFINNYNKKNFLNNFYKNKKNIKNLNNFILKIF
ncbi:hypothetical protein K5B08_01230, partial [Candidatus Carsonella ruddii]|nr:hypothetical protein [Candidatus Carsonella ruddii]